MRIHFDYEKNQVIQALRYHFISRIEIRIMLILVNVFALFSILLYAFHKVTAMAFLVGSSLWIILMISFWFVMPIMVYKRNQTFKNSFSMNFGEDDFTLEHEFGSRAFDWKRLAYFKESPYFFYLYFDSRSFFLVPKSGCRDKDEVSELRELLKSKTKRK